MYSWTKNKEGIHVTNTTLDNTISRVVFFLEGKEIEVDNVANYNAGVPFTIPLSISDVYKLEEFQLKQINVTYEVGNNILTGVGLNVGEYIYADKPYKVSSSTSTSIVLEEPIGLLNYVIYQATEYHTCVDYTYSVEKIIKDRVLKSCVECIDKKAHNAQDLLDGFNLNVENCTTKKRIMNRIKSTLNIRC